jgi:DNA-binding transcriptional MerR regulator
VELELMTIGAFAGRTRLSPKALRLYDRLGLLSPARADPVSGYRFYSEDQVAGARLIALLRHLGMPLAVIADVAAKPPAEAAQAVAGYWAGVETVMADRRALVSYIQATLTGVLRRGQRRQRRADRTVPAGGIRRRRGPGCGSGRRSAPGGASS